MLRRIKAIFGRSTSPAQIRIVPREVFQLTSEEWRQDETLVRQAQKTLSDPVVQQMLDVLRNSHLAMYTCVGGMEQKAFQQCRAEGFNAALQELKSLGVLEKKKVELEATFEKMEVED